MRAHLASLLVGLTGVGLSAQQVTISPSMVTPWTLATQLGMQSDQRTGPSVPSLEQSVVDLGGGGLSRAVVDATSDHGPWAAWFLLRHEVEVTNPGQLAPANATATTEVRVVLQATVTTLVELHLEAGTTGGGGGPAPLVEFDVDDDGTIDSVGGAYVAAPVALVPGQPKTIRIRMQTSVAGSGGRIQTAQVTVLPDSAPTVDWMLGGCSDLHYLSPRPMFGGDLDLGPYANVLEPMVVVIGLGLQPVVLPAAVPPPLCILVPAPDILVPVLNVVPPPVVPLSLPPSVRPVTFWLQAVGVSAIGLPVTDAFRVDAL